MSSIDWIPCKEKLPEKAGWYNVKTAFGETKMPYLTNTKGELAWLTLLTQPTHWQPPQEEPKTAKG